MPIALASDDLLFPAVLSVLPREVSRGIEFTLDEFDARRHVARLAAA